MLSFLKLVFGPDITVKGFDYTDDTPYYGSACGGERNPME